MEITYIANFVCSIIHLKFVVCYIHLQVASALPNTSYFKMVDIWLLFCIFSAFLVIVFHVFVSLTDSSGKVEEKNETWNEETVKRGKHVKRCWFPKVANKKRNASCFTNFFNNRAITKLSKIVTFLLFVIFNVIYWMNIYFS